MSEFQKVKNGSLFGGGLGRSNIPKDEQIEVNELGRFPSNFIYTGCDEVFEEFDKAGRSKSIRNKRGGAINSETEIYNWNKEDSEIEKYDCGYNDEGSAARFFYCSKASGKEKNEGLDELEDKRTSRMATKGGTSNIPSKGMERFETIQKNNHPTVKPIKLMTYLINMITPPNGIVIDPFLGSGSTGVAAVKAGFKFIGIEKEEEYMEIAEKRMEYNVS